MSSRRSISRRDFLHGLFSPAGAGTAPAPAFFETDSPAQGLSQLPPEFSGAMLKMEATRLGGDPETMTEEEMAALVLKAMYGAPTESASRQEANGGA